MSVTSYSSSSYSDYSDQEEDLKSPSSPPPTRHDIIIAVSKALGYKSNDGGVCNGIATMGMLAAMVGEGGVFNARIEDINLLFHKHSQDPKAVATEINDDVVLLNTMLPFFELVELCQQPYLYPDLFEEGLKPIFQEDARSVESLLSLLSSNTIRDRGGLAEIARFSGVYYRDELIAYLRQLKEAIDSSSVKNPVGIKLGNTDHAISIVYDPKQKNWLFPESTELSIGRVEDDCIDDVISYQLMRGEPIIVSSQIYTFHGDTQLKIYLNTESFKKLHEPTSEKVHFLDSENNSWLTLACILDQKDIVRSLISPLTIDQRSLEHKLTPLHIAVMNRSLEVVKILVHASADVNLTDYKKRTPLDIALKNRDFEIVKVLISP